MKSNEELYEFVHQLTAYLEELGDHEAAVRVNNPLYISSVATEVFMALRQELSNLLNSEINLDAQYRARVADAITSIGTALR